MPEIPLPLQGVLCTVAIAVLGSAALHARWSDLLDTARSHWWCACVVCIVMLRSLDAVPVDGLRLHLLGTTLMYVVLGLPLALWAAAIAGVGICIMGHEPFSDLASNFLLRGALPIAIAWCVFRILPRGIDSTASPIPQTGMAFVAGASASVIVLCVSLVASDVNAWKLIASDQLVAMLLLIASAEAQLCLIGSALLLMYGQRRQSESARADRRLP